ncbi:hypothetical protein [Nitrosomonas ureae]|uniref:Uncharacterized protein n=1 Tax=Nitrosomonas ureae TaxID=44577 RepID=A0A2T5I5B8_9PROT|nr:hypothetical protein [Nitrosomonas ureae]PTQ79014.1 hypothetical protein C8R28_105915 [Nitrosomonas ureae]
MWHSHYSLINLLFASLILLLSQVVSAKDLNLVLSPIVTNPTGNSLGSSSLKKASDYFETVTKEWEYPFVKPEYNDENNSAAVTNPQDLVPHELIIIPQTLTIRTSQTQGSLFDGERRHSGRVGGIPATKPANDTIFIYALNKKGKLIYPLARNPHGSGFVPTYETLTFWNHSNRDLNSQAIVAAVDVDHVGGGGTDYDPNSPATNPPWALMVRARIPGFYRIQIESRINNIIVSSSDRQLPDILTAVTRTNVEVVAIDGPELIDQLIVKGVAPQKPCINTKPCLLLKQGESIELSAVGRVAVKEWNEERAAYIFRNHRQIALQRVTWSYDDTPKPVPDPKVNECISLKTINSNGSSIKVIAEKLPSNSTSCKGMLKIEGHGKMFKLDVTVME